MSRQLHSVVVSLVLLASSGCNSTLDEFRCTEASHCEDVTNMGRCEPSGHCSFVDTSCVGSGFRFGKSAGDESGECVSVDPIDGEEDAGVVDAGVVDASPVGPLPIARISPANFGVCGLSLTVDGSTSEAFEGATIESFAWTLFSGADEIDSFTDVGGARLERGIHRLGGDHQAPIINLPNYHGSSAARTNISLGLNRTTIFQRDVEVSPQNYRLFFAAALGDDVEIGQNVVTVQLMSLVASFPLGDFEVTKGKFSGHQVDFSIPTDFDVGNGTSLQFKFASDGEHWLDNVALIETMSGATITENESFESDEEDPWQLGDGFAQTGSINSREIEPEFRKTRGYLVRLQVTDTNGQSSEFAELLVDGNPGCF